MSHKTHNVLLGIFCVFLLLCCSTAVALLVFETAGISLLTKIFLSLSIFSVFAVICVMIYDNYEWW